MKTKSSMYGLLAKHVFLPLLLPLILVCSGSQSVLAGPPSPLSPEQAAVRASSPKVLTTIADGSFAHPFPCDGSVSPSGGPAEDTKWWQLPAKKGRVYISYDLYTIPDTVDVYYGNQLVFSTNGLQSGTGFYSIDYGPGGSDKLKVVINKGNNTDSGTAWTYSIFARFVELSDTNDGSIIHLNDTAWITGDDPPAMPQLVATVRNPDPNVNVVWSFKCTYKRPRHTGLADDTVKVPADGTTITLPANQPFQIAQYYNSLPFFGGDAELDYTVGSDPPEKITFKILGHNPAPSVARSYFNNTLHAPWYFYAIGKSESEPGGGVYNQFWQKKVTRNGRVLQIGEPLFGADATGPGGFGMYQITQKSPLVAREILWNWQKNAKAGLDILTDTGGKIDIANTWMTNQRLASLSDAGTVVPVPDQSYPGVDPVIVTFADGTNRVIEDAVAIKGYNGSSKPKSILYPKSGFYCYWATRDTDNSPLPAKRHHWAFVRANTLGFNYVERVCSKVEE